jgi:hypothetical protein
MATMTKTSKMRRKPMLRVLLPFVIAVASIITNVIGRQPPEFRQVMPANVPFEQACLPDSKISTAVGSLSFGSYEDQQEAVTFLKTSAERSTACRKQVIESLSTAMDQPDLDLTGGRPQFYLWLYGARILGELKAVEALDLLIANFHLHDGSGFPLNHYPALGGVIIMGEVALPKLRVVLRDNPNRYTRRHAVFCIALIGGRSAEEILKRALVRESDACTTSCIRATLTSFNNKRRPHHISDERRTDWYTTFLCNGE